MKAEKLWTRNFILIMIVSLFSGFLVNFFTNTMPVYAEEMTHTAVYAGLVTTTYTVAALATRPLVGVACEKMDSKKLIICGLILMTVSCFGYMFAATIWIILAIRIIHGIGFGIKTTASGVLVADIIPKSRFAEGIGMFGLYLPVTNAIGPAFGLYVVESGKFSTLFVIAGGLGCIAIILMMLMKDSGNASLKSKVTEVRTDEAEHAAGCRTANEAARAAADEAASEIVKMENGASSEAVNKDANDSTVNHAGLVELPKTFLKFEFGVVYPSIVLALTYFGYSAIISFIALYGQSEGMKGVGLFFTIGAVALFISRYIFAKLVKKFGYHRFVVGSLVLFAVILILIPYTRNMYLLYGMSVFYGIALGIVPMAVNAQVLERCSMKRRGTATAAYTSAMDIGIGIGSITLGIIVEMTSFKIAFGVAGAVCLVAVAVYLVTVVRDHEEYKKRMEEINMKLRRQEL